MGSLLSIKSNLKPLGLYKLSSDTLIHAELCAYAAGLDFLNQKLNELEDECFICTSTSYGLDLRERLFGYTRNSLSNSVRREMLSYRNAITVNDFTKSCIERAINACGIEVSIVENTAANTFFVNCINVLDTTKTQEELVEKAEEFLPAHLISEFDFGELNWNNIESRDITFSEMDSADLTWQQIDNY